MLVYANSFELEPEHDHTPNQMPRHWLMTYGLPGF